MEKELGWIRPILALLHLSIVTSAPSTTLNPCFTALWRTWTTWICLTLIRPLIRSKPTPLRRSLDAAQPSLKVRENDMIIVDATLTYMMKSLGSFGNSYTFPHFRITINSLNPWNITPVTVRIVVWLKASKINVNIFRVVTLWLEFAKSYCCHFIILLLEVSTFLLKEFPSAGLVLVAFIHHLVQVITFFVIKV